MFIKEMEKNEQLAFLKLVAYSLSVGRMVQKDEEDTDSYLAPKILLDYLLEMEFEGSDVVRAYRTMGKGYREIIDLVQDKNLSPLVQKTTIPKQDTLEKFSKEVEGFLSDKTDGSLEYVRLLLRLRTDGLEVGRVFGNVFRGDVYQNGAMGSAFKLGALFGGQAFAQTITKASDLSVSRILDEVLEHQLPKNFNQDFDQIYNLPKDLREITNKKIFLCEVLDFYENIPCECFVKEDFINQICHFLRIDSEELKECQDFLKEIKDSQEKINQATLASIQTFKDITHKLKGLTAGQETIGSENSKVEHQGEENE